MAERKFIHRLQMHQYVAIGDAIRAGWDHSRHDYKTGTTDATIAAALGVGEGSVSGLRRQLFPPQPKPKAVPVPERLDAIEARLAALEKRLPPLEDMAAELRQ